MLFETERLVVKEAAESDIERICGLGLQKNTKKKLRTQITFFVFLKTRRLPNMKDTPS